MRRRWQGGGMAVGRCGWAVRPTTWAATSSSLAPACSGRDPRHAIRPGTSFAPPSSRPDSAAAVSHVRWSPPTAATATSSGRRPVAPGQRGQSRRSRPSAGAASSAVNTHTPRANLSLTAAAKQAGGVAERDPAARRAVKADRPPGAVVRSSAQAADATTGGGRVRRRPVAKAPHGREGVPITVSKFEF